MSEESNYNELWNEAKGLAARNIELDKWRLALESLTPNGSEFVNDLDACMKYILDRRQSEHESRKVQAKRIRELETALENLSNSLVDNAEEQPK